MLYKENDSFSVSVIPATYCHRLEENTRDWDCKNNKIHNSASFSLLLRTLELRIERQSHYMMYVESVITIFPYFSSSLVTDIRLHLYLKHL